LALALRLYHLDGQSLWADEGNSAALAGRPFAVIAEQAALDIHPPLYYWLLKIWCSLFGQSDRCFSRWVWWSWCTRWARNSPAPLPAWPPPC
jgi:uncharacterized membrane protein